MSPPRDAEPVKPKDEECFEGAETEGEGFGISDTDSRTKTNREP